MSRLYSETDDYKFTLSKFERERIFKLLKPLGCFEAAREFIKDIDSLFVFDKTYGASRSPTDKQQYEIFTKILKHSDALLDVLKSIRRGDDDICVDVHTATLIYMSRSILVQEKLRSLNELPKENSLQISDSKFVDFTYPTQLIKSLDEMRNAVAHAAKTIKPKRGNSVNRNSKTIRKEHLANSFVARYQIRFNKLPPISIDGQVRQVFDLLLFNAGLSDGDNFNCLRSAIRRARDRTKMLTANAQ